MQNSSFRKDSSQRLAQESTHYEEFAESFGDWRESEEVRTPSDLPPKERKGVKPLNILQNTILFHKD